MADKHIADFCPACGAPNQPALRHGRMRPVCAACGHVVYQDPKLAVIAFLQQNNQLLLAQRNIDPGYGLWSLPGGYVELGEHPIETLEREIREETGLQIRADRVLDIFYSYMIQFHHAVIIAYSATITGGELLAGDDAAAVAWFTKTTLPELAFHSTRALVYRWVDGDL